MGDLIMNLIKLIDEIKIITDEVYTKSDEISNLSARKQLLIIKLQENCEHPESMQRHTSVNFTDEYGKRTYTIHKYHCDICNKLIRKYTKYSNGDMVEEML